MTKPRYAVSISLTEEQWREALALRTDLDITQAQIYMEGVKALKISSTSE